MPCPSALDDGVERLELWSPTKLLFDSCRGSDKPRRIARSARVFNRVDLSAGDFATGCDYLLNTRAASSPKVVEAAVGCTERDLQHGGNQMCLRPMVFAEILGGTGCVEITQ